MPFTVYITDENLACLEDEAFASHESISEVLNFILSDYFYYGGDV